jgi:ClpP class serine protease
MSKTKELLQTLTSDNLEVIKQLSNNKSMLLKNRDMNTERRQKLLSLIDETILSRKKSVMIYRQILTTQLR